MTERLYRLLADRSGATAIEYGLIIGLMATALIAGFGAASGAVSDVLLRAKDALIVP